MLTLICKDQDAGGAKAVNREWKPDLPISMPVTTSHACLAASQHATCILQQASMQHACLAASQHATCMPCSKPACNMHARQHAVSL